MSVEHGGHHGESVGDIIATLFLAFLIFPFAIIGVEEVVQELAGAGEGHGGH